MPVKLVEETERRYKRGSYNIKCRMCGSSDTAMRSDGTPIWEKDKDIKGIWTGRFICYECYYKKEKVCWICGISKKANPKIRISKNYDMFGYWTGEHICHSCSRKIKSRSEYGRLNTDTSVGKQYIGEAIVSKVLNIPIGTVYLNGRRLPFSLIDDDHGIISVKTARLRRGRWYFRTERAFLADIYFCLGFDEKWDDVIAVYIVPNDVQLSNIAGFYVHHNEYGNFSEYEWFSVDPTIYNDIYHSLNVTTCGAIKNTNVRFL